MTSHRPDVPLFQNSLYGGPGPSSFRQGGRMKIDGVFEIGLPVRDFPFVARDNKRVALLVAQSSQIVFRHARQLYRGVMPFGEGDGGMLKIRLARGGPRK